MPSEDTDLHQAFDQIIAQADSPIWIVTTTAEHQRAGCLVGFAAQVSIEPRRFLICLSKNNHTYRVAERADFLAVHLLHEEGLALAHLFGAETSFDMDKFEHCEWRADPHDLPILNSAAGWFSGRIVQRADFGDHVGFVLDPMAARAPEEPARVLRYRDVAGLSPGRPAGIAPR